MADKKDFKEVQLNVEEIEEKIMQHRRKVFNRVVRVILILLACIAGAGLWMALKSYNSYEIKNTMELGDKSASRYKAFRGNILEYSNDGIVYMDGTGRQIWNQSFEMVSPQVTSCQKYLAVFDKNGTDIYLMNETGLVKNIETTMVISTVCVADQGTVAVLMTEDENYYVKLYDKNGKELAGGEFFGEQGKIPVDIALSYDAQKLAVDMVDITSGALNTTISFYNFGSVGQNEINNIVGTYTYEDIFIPEIEYVSNDRMIALGNSEFMIFEGAQKPKLKKEIQLDKEVSNVFYTEKYIGAAYSNNDEKGTMHICVYDMGGNMAMENDTDMQYSDIDFLSNNEVCLTGQYECEIYTVHSIKKFSYTFDTEIYKVLYESGVNNYIIIHEGAMDEVRLK